MFASSENTEDENCTVNFGNNENDVMEVRNFFSRSAASSHSGSEGAFDSGERTCTKCLNDALFCSYEPISSF